MRPHHGQNTHQVHGDGILLDSLSGQFHQEHQHVVDSLVDLCAPLVDGTAGQQLQSKTI